VEEEVKAEGERQVVTCSSEDHPPPLPRTHNLRRNWPAVHPHTPLPPIRAKHVILMCSTLQ
jgi:hypothetical protein